MMELLRRLQSFCFVFSFRRSGHSQQFLEVRKRGVGCYRSFIGIRILSILPFCLQGAGMFVVVTVDAQQLPVAAVGGIVPVIMVFVVDSQLVQFFAGKLPAAFCANPREDLQRLISVLFFHSFFFRFRVRKIDKHNAMGSPASKRNEGRTQAYRSSHLIFTYVNINIRFPKDLIGRPTVVSWVFATPL